MQLRSLALLFTLITASIACPAQSRRAEDGTLEALVAYEVACEIGGNAWPKCYEGGLSGCRCDSRGTLLCQDAECRQYCGCGRYVFLSFFLFFDPILTSCSKESRPLANFPKHADSDISVIWHNLYADSDFLCFRKESRGPIERILVDFAKALETGVFEEVVSVNVSKHMFCVTVICTKNKNEGVMDAVFMVL